jgi:probable rRNA maturation factor
MANARSYRVDVRVDGRYAHLVPAARVRAAVRAALADQAAPAGGVSVRVTGDAYLRRLNRDFLGHDYATDVLSFPAAAPGYHGDLALSLPRARTQARAGRHRLLAEIQLLLVHGTLHLLGFDHDTPRRQARMWAAQARILSKLGAAITSPADHTRKPG